MKKFWSIIIVVLATVMQIQAQVKSLVISDVTYTLEDFAADLSNINDRVELIEENIHSVSHTFGSPNYFLYNGKQMPSFQQWLADYISSLDGQRTEHTIDILQQSFEKVNPKDYTDKRYKFNAILARNAPLRTWDDLTIAFVVEWKGTGHYVDILEILGKWYKEPKKVVRKTRLKIKQKTVQIQESSQPEVAVANTYTCKGIVVEDTPVLIPIVGASVMIKGKSDVVVTDSEGRYRLNGVKEGDQIVIDIDGRYTREYEFKSDYKDRLVRTKMPKDTRNVKFKLRPKKTIPRVYLSLLAGSYLHTYAVCGMIYSNRANAMETMRYLSTHGYKPAIAYNKYINEHYVIVDSFDSYDEALACMQDFIDRFPQHQDFKRAQVIQIEDGVRKRIR